ncbi:MAG TPA: choice-of-anchor tandem repeat GloVer-containing protein, partial [Chthoniobacteraceae bacterium]
MNPKQQSSFAPWEAAFARDGNFYGSTLEGGLVEGGLIYKFNQLGQVRGFIAFPRIFSSPAIRNFGSNPEGKLAEASDGSLYGSTRTGGVFGNGVIYRAQRDGRLSFLYHYRSQSGGGYKGTVVCSEEGTLYAIAGGGQTLVQLARDGTEQTYDLPSLTGSGGFDLLITAAGEVLVGTTHRGIWKLTPDGSFEFFGGEGFHLRGIKQLQDGSVVGIASQSLSEGPTRIFRVDAEGTYSVLHEFALRFEGLNPFWVAVQTDGSLVGATSTGGLQDAGTLFKIIPETGVFSVLNHLSPHFFNRLGSVWMEEALSYATESLGNLKPATKDDIVPAQRLKAEQTEDANAPLQVKINVLANDNDADGDLLTIIAVGAPLRGVASLDELTGKIIYTADGAEAQNDSFTYTVSDGKGGTATANVIIRTKATGRYEGIVTSRKVE